MCNFYHYTDDKGANNIIRSGIIQASLKNNLGNGDATYGNGVYLTQLNPYTSTKDEIALNNWTRSNAVTALKLKNYFIIYIPKSDVKKVYAVDRNIFLFGYGNDLRLHKYPWVLKDYDTGAVIASYKYRVSSSWPASRRCSIMGDYVIMDEIVNGRPVYKNTGGDHLHISSQGEWLLGTDFTSQGSYLSQKSEYALGPDQKVPWAYCSPLGKWTVDDTIKVRPVGSFDNEEKVRKSKPFNILENVTKISEGVRVIIRDTSKGIVPNKNAIIGILPNKKFVLGRAMAYREDSVEIFLADVKLLGSIRSDRPFLKPYDMISLSNGEFAILDNLGLQLFSKDGVFIKALLQTRRNKCFGLAEDEDGNVITINFLPPSRKRKLESKRNGSLTDLGETDIFFISRETGEVLRQIELTELISDKKESKCRFLNYHNNVIYIVDLGCDCIYKIKISDNEVRHELTVVGESGTGPKQFKDPAGIAVDDFGNFIVADSGNRRLQIFDKENNFVGVVAPVFALRSSSLYLDKDRGELYVLNCLDTSMVKYRITTR